MSKNTTKDHDTEQPQEPVTTQELPMPDEAQTYFFPNDGGVMAFSCRADSLKEAEERNQEHLQQFKETE